MSAIATKKPAMTTPSSPNLAPVSLLPDEPALTEFGPASRTSARKKKAPAKAKEPKETPWSSLSDSDLTRCLKGFLHFTGKTIHSSVNEVSIRLANNQSRPELPYVALSTLGATLNELDYTEGGAGFVRKPRQIKDVVTGRSSGALRDMSKVPAQELANLAPDSPFVEALKTARFEVPNAVPVLLKQVIVRFHGTDISLTPLGAVGLNSVILARLDAERSRRAALDSKQDRPFWGRAGSALGGKKP